MLANLFLHYAFDRWVQTKHPEVLFERYADDVVCHCRTKQQAEKFLSALRERLARPAHHTWQSYALFLLDSMPTKTAQHYRTKIAIYLKWYLDRDYPQGIPEEQEKDLGSRDIPSWRRICRVLIRNDFWCRTLSFGPNKPQHYSRYLQRMQKKREEWGLL